MVAVRQSVELVRSETQRLQGYLQTLAPDAWSRPSACDGWTVADVVAHLVFVAEFWVDTISRGIQGDASSPKDRPPGEAENLPSVDEYFAQRATARREELGDQLLPTFSAVCDQVNALFAGLGPEDWEKPCAFWRSRTLPVREIIVVGIQELAVHGWDIRSNLEPSAQLDPTSVAVLLERVPRRPFSPWGTEFQGAPSQPDRLRYRFEITGPGASNQDIVVDGGRARMEPAGPDAANVTIRCDTSTLVLLMYGRLTLESARRDGRLVVQGEPVLASAFDRWLKDA